MLLTSQKSDRSRKRPVCLCALKNSQRRAPFPSAAPSAREHARPSAVLRGDEKTRTIVLLDVCSSAAAAAAAAVVTSLGRRGQRLCGSGLATSRGVLHQAAEDFPPVHSVHEKPSGRRDIRSDTRTLRAPASSIESFLHTPTYDGGEGGRGRGWDGGMLAGDQSSIASSWSAKSSNMLPMSSRMDTVVFFLGGGKSQQSPVSVLRSFIRHPSIFSAAGSLSFTQS